MKIEYFYIDGKICQAYTSPLRKLFHSWDPSPIRGVGGDHHV